jgi:formamidopyrimidine-DNA glycosylase
MPELPEVETIIKGLRPHLVGKTIKNIEVLLPKTVWIDDIRATGSVDIAMFKSLLEGQKIDSITRRGKMIIINISEGRVLLIHLKMTGQLIYVNSQQRLAGGHPNADMIGDLPVKATRLIIDLGQKQQLYFNDQRQFGYIKLLFKAALENHKAYMSFGPEPFESSFNEQYLYSVLKKRYRVKIKQLLLDQSVVAGIGNIYADESLFESGIHPARLAGSLSQAHIKRLLIAIKLVLNRGLKYGGTSSQHYVQADGKQGTMQDHLMVYRREAQSCNRCGVAIERMVVGGRGTHFCPNCQPLT